MDQNEVWRKTLSTMKSGREPIIYSLNWEKFAIFFFLLCKVFAFPDLTLLRKIKPFSKGVENLKRRFSSRGAAVAECQNRKRECFKFIAVARIGRECSSQEGSLGDLTDARLY